MKTKFYLLASFAIFLSILSSCIKDEPMYMEAEIEGFRFVDSIYLETKINENSISVMVKRGTDLAHIKPIISISPNATISPSPESVEDFRGNVVFTITSEDGLYNRDYVVQVVYPPTVMRFDFEDWEIVQPFRYFAYKDANYPFWDSANSGVWWAGIRNNPYPTRDTTNAYLGKQAALLETVKGKYIAIINEDIPIFSGNLFTGRFKLNQKEPLKSTLFGQIHPKESGMPSIMTGYYKYQPGPEFIVNGEVVPDKVDECDIYAVLYKVTKGELGLKEYLDGETIQSSDKIVALAKVEDGSAKEEYTRFSVPFKYTDKVDYDKNDYKLAIVFASSRRGAHYEGAIGSKLIIDQVEVTLVDYRE